MVGSSDVHHERVAKQYQISAVTIAMSIKGRRWTQL